MIFPFFDYSNILYHSGDHLGNGWAESSSILVNVRNGSLPHERLRVLEAFRIHRVRSSRAVPAGGQRNTEEPRVKRVVSGRCGGERLDEEVDSSPVGVPEGEVGFSSRF